MNSYLAFQDASMIASGPAHVVAVEASRKQKADQSALILFFEASTGKQVDFDLRGTEEEVAARLGTHDETTESRGVGRPKLGVEAHEVTLLPRHWEWLREQPGGASVALRKLVEEARKANADKDRVRIAQDATARFAGVMAGDRSGFEEAMRALYASDEIRFKAMIMHWPKDIREAAWQMAEPAFCLPEPNAD